MKRYFILNALLIFVVTFELVMKLVRREYGSAVFAAGMLGANLMLPFALYNAVAAREATETARIATRHLTLKQAEVEWWKSEAEWFKAEAEWRKQRLGL